jgi:hypothetical protein
LSTERNPTIEDHCESCGYDGRNDTLAQVTRALGAFPNQLSEILERADDSTIRLRPGPDSWSAIEYVGHLRDLMAYHRWLIERALAEDTPTFEPVDPDNAVAEAGYLDADLAELLDQTRRRVERLVSLLASLHDDGQHRALVVPSEGRIDIGIVARSAVHEAHHHSQDLQRLLAR